MGGRQTLKAPLDEGEPLDMQNPSEPGETKRRHASSAQRMGELRRRTTRGGDANADEPPVAHHTVHARTTPYR